jgi:hypothetical protein
MAYSLGSNYFEGNPDEMLLDSNAVNLLMARFIFRYDVPN